VKKFAAAAAFVLLLPVLALPVMAFAISARQGANSPCGPVGGASGATLAASAAALAGFQGQDLVIAAAIAGAESSYQPTARNSIGASGLWQILESAHRDLFTRYDWRDPAQNAAMAHAVWLAAGRSWQPWTTFTSGAYLSHLAEARAADASTPTDSCGTANGPAPPTPFAGRAVGCSVLDPSGTGGCVTPALAALMHQVEERFGHLPVACWSARGGDPYSDHPVGRACDYTFGRIGAYPGPDDVRRGWALATWLRANAVPLHVSYVIWQGRIWSRAHDAEGWRPYTGGGHYSTSGPTNSHSDHVHVSTAQ